ncbi:hypothetical protein GCM10022239_20670 [Leifsonia bigeumensis]|uniref:Right handed beta helix domain-containing protein n=1 Tax=Leifsonella bigeumensis TaxID=433643 RepID=A0ABP7FPH2_9MICO
MKQANRWGAIASVSALTAGLLALGAGPARAAESWTVCASGCDYTTISAAVSGAAAGDTIVVQAGTYAESIVIDKSLTILGPNAGVNPNSADFVTANPARASEAIILPPAVENSDAISLAAAATTVTLSGLTVDLSGALDSQRFLSANSVPNLQLTLSQNVWTNGGSSTPGALAITGALGDPTVRFEQNRVVDGAASNGLRVSNSSANGTTTVSITGNTWLDNDGLAMNISGAASVTTAGTIGGNWIGNSTVGTAGVDNFGLRQGGMVLAGDFTGLRVENNTLQNIEDAAISIWTGFSGTAVITGNHIDGYSNVTGFAAIFVRQSESSVVSDVTGIEFSGNFFDNPTTGSRALLNQSDTGDFTATANWWGQATGPAAGQIVGSNVLVDPWLASDTSGSTVYGAEVGADPEVSFAGYLPGDPLVNVSDASFTGTTGSAWIEALTLTPGSLPAGETPFSVDGAILLDLSMHSNGDIVATGPYTVCVTGAAPDRLWHYEDGAWVDISGRQLGSATLSAVPGMVCGMVNDFSPFALAATTMLAATGSTSGTVLIPVGLLMLLLGALVVAGTARWRARY